MIQLNKVGFETKGHCISITMVTAAIHLINCTASTDCKNVYIHLLFVRILKLTKSPKKSMLVIDIPWEMNITVPSPRAKPVVEGSLNSIIL